MQKIASLLVLVLAFALPLDALAATRYIGDLTEGELLGPVSSSAQLQSDFEANGKLIAQASERLGLAPSEYHEVRDAVARGEARYVVLPRHLEHGGVAFAVHDIEIPAGVHGWEVDIARPDGTLRVFVPNACGNISYLLVPHRRILAAVPPMQIPTPGPVPLVAPAPQIPVASEPVAFIPPPVIVPAVAGGGLWPLLALIPLAFIGGGGSIHVPIGPGPPPPPSTGRGLLLTLHPRPITTPCPPPANRHPGRP